VHRGSAPGWKSPFSAQVRRTQPRRPGAYCFFKQTFGPVVGLSASLASQPERFVALDRDFVEFAMR
jgi:hypothetical protein